MNLLIDYYGRLQGCASTLQKHIQGLVSKLAELCHYFLVWGRSPLWTRTHTHTGKSLMSSRFTECSSWHAEWSIAPAGYLESLEHGTALLKAQFLS